MKSTLSVPFPLVKDELKFVGLSIDFRSLSFANGLYKGRSSCFFEFVPHFGSFGGGKGGGWASSVVHKRSVMLLCFLNFGRSGVFPY